MKCKLLIVFLTLCLVLCACGDRSPATTTDAPVPLDPTTGGNAEPIPTPAESTPELTLPSHFEGVQLPDDEFDDPTSSKPTADPTEPVTEAPPVETLPPTDVPSQDPTSPTTPGIVLPEDEF